MPVSTFIEGKYQEILKAACLNFYVPTSKDWGDFLFTVFCLSAQRESLPIGMKALMNKVRNKKQMNKCMAEI